MGIVDITDISKPFFVTTVLFLIFILSFLSLGILQVFNKRYKRMILFLALGILSAVTYGLLVYYWLADTMPKTP